jgi:hypothetical protein
VNKSGLIWKYNTGPLGWSLTARARTIIDMIIFGLAAYTFYHACIYLGADYQETSLAKLIDGWDQITTTDRAQISLWIMEIYRIILLCS